MVEWKIAAGLVVVVTLAGCQHSPQRTPISSPAPIATVDCAAATPGRIQTLERKISALEAKQARGYRTKSTVVRIANPLKLCTSPVPYVSLCTPSPKLSSSLPSFSEYKRERARLAALQREHAQLRKARAACR